MIGDHNNFHVSHIVTLLSMRVYMSDRKMAERPRKT